MNPDDFEEYGVFGGVSSAPIYPPSEEELRQRAIFTARRESEQAVSRNFNRYMIDLYNGNR